MNCLHYSACCGLRCHWMILFFLSMATPKVFLNSLNPGKKQCGTYQCQKPTAQMVCHFKIHLAPSLKKPSSLSSIHPFLLQLRTKPHLPFLQRKADGLLSLASARITCLSTFKSSFSRHLSLRLRSEFLSLEGTSKRHFCIKLTEFFFLTMLCHETIWP